MAAVLDKLGTKTDSCQYIGPTCLESNPAYRLDNATRIVFEHDFLHLTPYDVHELFDMFFPLLLGDVELARIRPDALGLLNDFSIGFCCFALRIKFFLNPVRFFSCCKRTVKFVRRYRSEADEPFVSRTDSSASCGPNNSLSSSSLSLDTV